MNKRRKTPWDVVRKILMETGEWANLTTPTLLKIRKALGGNSGDGKS